jgi:hypothetical protein
MAEIVGANDPIAADGPAIMQELDVEEPFAPQRQYAIDQQGTLAKWLVEDTDGANDDELLRVMASLNAKYWNVVANQVDHAEMAVSLLKELAEDVLATEGLECFLAGILFEVGKPTVIVVSGLLSRYRPALGTASGWTGQVFGFFGEVGGGQMPPLFKLPDAYLLCQALEP